MSTSPLQRLEKAFRRALDLLLAHRNSEGYWTGELSTSALSTATAVCALALVRQHSSRPFSHSSLVERGLVWLAEHQNTDGGWGDTSESVSNISTTMLGRAALHLAGGLPSFSRCDGAAEAYLQAQHGRTVSEQAEAVRSRYGKDRTFAVPILTTCALAGLVNWSEVAPLPFELACFPQSWFRFLRLPMVSYALPALIAVGQAIYHHRRPRNPVLRVVRRRALLKSRRILEAIQPSSGGFLEAVPLTSFVTLSLASIGQADHPVVRQALDFLTRSVRVDGSWAIDSNLSIWVTTQAINALAAGRVLHLLDRQEELQDWLQRQQFTTRHAYTGAEPGGWGWTHLPGSVPDADDTPGALLALAHLGLKRESQSLSDKRPPPSGKGDEGEGRGPSHPTSRCLTAAGQGVSWLLGLQNSNGGWPTFCRGWGKLAFDRSGTDLTAHALRALAAWQPLEQRQSSDELAFISRPTLRRDWHRSAASRLSHLCKRATKRGLNYLARSQRPDGSWLPLWFGNQHAPRQENPTYGSTRVLAAYRDLDMMNCVPARRGLGWLLSAQNKDGGWGGARGVQSSVEETALAVEVLLDAGDEATAAANKGVAWLVQQVEAGALSHPTPIGFYFAKLWYFEMLYPIIFTVAALGHARQQMSDCRDLAHHERTP